MTTYHTLKGEKLLKTAGLKYKTIMKPRYISSDCGLAVTFEPERFFEAVQIIRTALASEIVGFFEYQEGEWRKIND